MFSYLLSNEIKYKGIKIITGEYAWKYKDVIGVIDILQNNGYVILGGDVLGKNFAYTYDNWFFENGKSVNVLERITESAKKARQYINWHHNNFGNEFYYVLVVEKAI